MLRTLRSRFILPILLCLAWLITPVVQAQIVEIIDATGDGSGNTLVDPISIAVDGTVSGLAGSGLMLQNNKGDDLAVTMNGTFTFDLSLLDATGYLVTVLAQPTSLSQTCSVTNGNGTLAGANITNVAVACVTDSADLAATKTDAQDILVPGDPITYMITITNNGPFDVVGARVQDTFPAELFDPTWECIPGKGASCTQFGKGDIDQMVDIPDESSVSYTVIAGTDLAFVGVISNTVTVTAPANITDPIPGNNSATDTSATEALYMNGFEDPLLVLKRWLEEILKN